MIQLYPYQRALVNDIRAAWQRVRAVLMVLGTGGGKTVIFADIMHDHNGAAVAVAHRKEIITQISISLAKLDVRHRIVAPPATVKRIRRKHLKLFGKSFIDPHALCGVASVQTMTSAASGRDEALQRWVNQITLAVFDEGHHYVDSGVWARAVEVLHRAKLLFVTATPERADGKGLGAHAQGFAQELLEGPPTQWLIDNGYLSRFRYVAPESDLDVSGLAVTASGDFNTRALRQRNVESHIVGNAVTEYIKFAHGKRAIGFASDVETARDMARAFRAAGVPSVALDGTTDAAERDRELDKFESGETWVLWNVDLFDEGFDVPACECAILTRPTMSLAKFLQMVGRVLRVLAGKEYAVIIDLVRNWERHGMPNWPRVWSLDAGEGGKRGANSDTIPQRVCDNCTQPYEAYYVACPYCGHVPQPVERLAPKHVDGDLQELDVAALYALFAAMDKADMPDEDYAVDQIARHIPKIGRGPDMRRHQAGKHRRQVLRELVAWFYGCHPEGRPKGEIHKRFYFIFGVDVGTAFTLSLKETDALIGRIKSNFARGIM